MDENKFFCCRCHHAGQPKVFVKGSFWIEIVLWLTFIVPGLIYTIWRLTNKIKVCSRCGSADLVPADSPRHGEVK